MGKNKKFNTFLNTFLYIHNMKYGFTLLELSIVLVIIGLIIGGVVAGSSLIEAAKVNSQVAQINKLDVGVVAFKLKYNGLPGDLKNAVQYQIHGGSHCNDQNGNGDGVIAYVGQSSPGIFEGEPLAFNAQLNRSKIAPDIPFIANCSASELQIGKDFIESKIKDNVGITAASINGKNGFYIGLNGGCDGTVGGATCYNLFRYTYKNGVSRQHSINPSQSYILDVKMDDGMPNLGRVKAAVFGSSNTLVLQSGDGSDCLKNAISGQINDRVYNVSNISDTCNLWIDAGF